MIKETVVFQMKQSKNYKLPPPSRRINILYIDHRLAQMLIKLFYRDKMENVIKRIHLFASHSYLTTVCRLPSLVQILKLIFLPKIFKKNLGRHFWTPKNREGRVTGNIHCTYFFVLPYVEQLCFSINKHAILNLNCWNFGNINDLISILLLCLLEGTVHDGVMCR